ncbi:MAG: adenylate/guanylate cyclase domain-containing protein [Minisyncoccia bacterium]
MSLSGDLGSEINAILDQAWDTRDGNVVPGTADIALAGGGVNLKATMLYADLADSTDLAMWDRRVTARICKAFLACSTRLIKARGGDVRSFDGDRVMGVFVGDGKNTSAVKCGMQINWMFLNLLKPKFEARYDALRNGTYKLAHCTGIDTSDVLVVRTGIRNSNDLIWIGRAPNVAAKMSAFRNSPYHTYISASVYNSMSDEVKITNEKNMWEVLTWEKGPISNFYRSSWTWEP